MEMAQRAVPAAVTLIVFTTLALFVVSLRLYTRAVVVKNVGADDYLMIGAVGGSIGFLVVVFLQIKFGLGRMVSFEELPDFLMALWGTIPLYNLALMLCKISIAIQYYRVFRTPAVQKFLRCMFVFLVVYGLWTILGTVFTCVPVHKYWDFMAEGKCVDRNALTFANAGLNIATDITLLAIPSLLLRKLQIPRRQKFILVGVFACGAFACVMSIVRLRALYEIGIAPQEEQSINGVNIAIWSCIEINVGIICASVPAIKALVVQVFPKLLLSNIYARSKSRYNNNASGPDRSGHRHQLRSGHTATVTAGRSGGSSSATITTDPTGTKKPEIMVVQSFEMNAVTRGSGGSGGTGGDDSGSRDGSENGLVMTGWQADCYAGAMRRGDGGEPGLALWPLGQNGKGEKL